MKKFLTFIFILGFCCLSLPGLCKAEPYLLRGELAYLPNSPGLNKAVGLQIKVMNPPGSLVSYLGLNGKHYSLSVSIKNAPLEAWLKKGMPIELYFEREAKPIATEGNFLSWSGETALLKRQYDDNNAARVAQTKQTEQMREEQIQKAALERAAKAETEAAAAGALRAKKEEELNAQPPRLLVARVEKYLPDSQELVVTIGDLHYKITKATDVSLIQGDNVKVNVKRVDPSSPTSFNCVFVSYDDEFLAEQKTVAEKRQRALAEKVEQERKAAENREAEEKQQVEEKERQQQKLASDLISGKIKAQSFRQVVEILKPKDGTKLTTSPPLDGPSDNNQWYGCAGLLAKKDGDYFICWDAGRRSGFAFTNVRQKWGEITQNTYVWVVGRYIKNVSINLISGEETMIPLLADCYYYDGSR